MNKIILNYCSFVIACLVVIVAFITATTYTQLAVAILLYPVLVFFAFKVFPHKAWRSASKKGATTIQPSVTAEKVEEAKKEQLSISDIDKRVFLKLIGGAGITLFLFSLFNKNSEGLFFKKLPVPAGPGRTSLEDISGNKINPAQNQPIDGYGISEIDDNVISFYGFTNKDGAWYVMKIDIDNGSFRYSRGESDFPDNWPNRENLKYDYFSTVF